MKPEPQNEVPQGQSAHNNFWDFAGLTPESASSVSSLDIYYPFIRLAAHMITWVMSDRAIPRSFRMMQGFGVNTCEIVCSVLQAFSHPQMIVTLVNAQGKRSFVKFHWIPELGVHSLLWDEALKINGQDPGILFGEIPMALFS